MQPLTARVILLAMSIALLFTGAFVLGATLGRRFQDAVNSY